MVLQQNTKVTLWGWAFAGETVEVEASWGARARAVADKQGQWSVKVKTPLAQRLSKGLHPETITFTVPNENVLQIKDVLIGEVWLCSGQSNMEMMLRSSYPPGWSGWFGDAAWSKDSKYNERPGLRLFNLARAVSFTPQCDCASIVMSQGLEARDAHGLIPNSRRGWVACTVDTAPYFHAVPYYFAAALQEKLDVPVGLITSVVGGTAIECWMSLNAIRAVPAFENVSPVELNPFAACPTCLFNGMISPLTPMTIKGVIWYQGESNVYMGEAEVARYAELFRTLIADWRNEFGNEGLPFYYVEIAPFQYHRGDCAAELREAQESALQLPNTGMALSIDVGDAENIHPRDKHTIGKRLALQALAKTYGFKEIVADGPRPRSAAAENGNLRIAFSNLGGGLVSRDGQPLTCFEIADEHGDFVRADAVIRDNTVIVSSPVVAHPVAVRFAWGEADIPNLTSRDGLPVGPFKLKLRRSCL